MAAEQHRCEVVVEIGGLPIRLCCQDLAFGRIIEQRYAGYVSTKSETSFEFEIELAPPNTAGTDEDTNVTWEAGRWMIRRGDFRAQWVPSEGRGRIWQVASPFSLDSVLRIVHTLLLAERGGFLLHASSGVRNGRAFLFAGVSTAGKTTIARLAPPDVTLLTDEISYVTRQGGSYTAVGTPFYGELAQPGENIRAPVAALYLLAKGPENRIELVREADALGCLLRNILFFARDQRSVQQVFEAAGDFIGRVPIHRLTFVPEVRVWELIG